MNSIKRFFKGDVFWIRLFQLIVSLFLLLFFADLFATLYIRNKALVTQFELSEESPLQMARVLQIVQLEEKPYLLKSLDLETMKANLKSQPQVESIEIFYRFPDTLFFDITPSEAVGAILFQESPEKIIPFVFDKEGVLFLQGAEVADWNLPILSGDITVAGFQRGLKLPHILLPLIKDLYVLRKDYRPLYDLISELEIEITGEFSVETKLYFSDTNIPVRVERDLDPRLLEEALVSLEFIRKEGIETEELDLRSNKVTFQEGSSEESPN